MFRRVIHRHAAAWLLPLLLGCAPGDAPPAEICANGIDDDGDGHDDCDDDDCWSAACPEDCEGEADHDGDGLVGCQDPDCFPDCDEICDDGIDNDGDGEVDCADRGCDDLCPEDCADGHDNDGDGEVDCEDPDCFGLCAEDCESGIDEDGDGLVDCEDGDCLGASNCSEDCANGADDDLDGLADCQDDDCLADDSCTQLSMRFTSGRGRGERFHLVDYWRTAAMFGWWTTSKRSFHGTHLYGTLRRSGAISSATCLFGIPDLLLQHTTIDHIYHSSASKVEGSFIVQPGCPFKVEVLPDGPLSFGFDAELSWVAFGATPWLGGTFAHSTLSSSAYHTGSDQTQASIRWTHTSYSATQLSGTWATLPASQIVDQ